MSGDWLKLHRCVIESPVWRDPWLFQLWTWCLIKASYCDRRIGGIDVKRGSFVTGRSVASDELGVTGSKWYRGLQSLQELGCISLAANNHFTLVTVCNYERYQDGESGARTASEQRSNSDRTASEQRSNTEEERKNSTKDLSLATNDPKALDHERALITADDPPAITLAHKGWTPTEGMSPITVQAVRRWQEYYFVLNGRSLPFHRIEAELRARRKEGWGPQKFSDGVDLMIRLEKQRVLNPDEDLQASKQRSLPPQKPINPQLRTS